MVDFNEDRNVYFGDLYVYMSWFFDVFVFNVRIIFDDVYNFGKGGVIFYVSGKLI